MPTVIDILLKLKGDSKGAVQVFDDTTKAAQRTEKQVDKVGSRIEAMLKSLGRGQLVGLTSQIEGYIRQVADLMNMLFDVQGRIEAGKETVAGATSGQAKAAGFVQQAGAQASRFSVTRLIENLVTGGTTEGRRQEELRNILLGENAAVVAAALPYLPKEYQETGRKALDTLRARERGAAWQSKLIEQHRTTSTGGQVNITNNYPSGVNPRAVDQNMSRYERVNGQPRRP
jgi:hypothetical protein